MYHTTGPSNWFNGGMEVIAKRINTMGRRGAWARTAPANLRRRRSLRVLTARETGVKRRRT